MLSDHKTFVQIVPCVTECEDQDRIPNEHIILAVMHFASAWILYVSPKQRKVNRGPQEFGNSIDILPTPKYGDRLRPHAEGS